jgi:hypothetical protein
MREKSGPKRGKNGAKMREEKEKRKLTESIRCFFDVYGWNEEVIKGLNRKSIKALAKIFALSAVL